MLLVRVLLAPGVRSRASSPTEGQWFSRIRLYGHGLTVFVMTKVQLILKTVFKQKGFSTLFVCTKMYILKTRKVFLSFCNLHLHHLSEMQGLIRQTFTLVVSLEVGRNFAKSLSYAYQGRLLQDGFKSFYLSLNSS